MRRGPRNPLEPMGTVVFALLGLLGAVTVIGVLATIFGTGSVMGFGGSASVHAQVPGLVGASSDFPHGLWVLRPDVSAGTSGGYQLSVQHPSTAQRVLYTLTLLPGVVLFAGALLLTYRLIRGAERVGIFTLDTARQLRILGWFLLGGALAEASIRMVANNRLFASMVTNKVGWVDLSKWTVSWTVLITAAGVLTFARVMRIGAEMRDELQATV